MRLLERYVFREVAVPFVAWTALLCALFLAMAFLKGSEVLLGSGIQLSDIGAFVLFLLPTFLVRAIPVALLLALLLGLGRLSEDSELRAMQAVGVSPAFYLRGSVFLGLGLSAVLAILMGSVQPLGQAMMRRAATDVIRRNLMTGIQPGVFHEEVLNFTVYAEEVAPGGAWKHVLVHDARDPSQPLLVMAQAGAMQPTQWLDAVALTFSNGRIDRASRGADAYETLSFLRASVRADIGETVFQKNQFRSSNDEETLSQLLQGIEETRSRGEDARPAEITLHWRLGQMLMPLAFAFIGGPLATLRRGGRAWGVLLTLAGYFGFYALARVAMSLARAENLSPLLAGQLPNLVFLFFGACLFGLVARRGSA